MAILRKLLIWLSVPSILIVGLIGNYIFARRILLRLDNPADPIREISEHMEPVKQPVVFRSGLHFAEDTIRNHFVQQLRIPASVPDSGKDLIDIFEVAISNPNPQPLDVIRKQDVNYFSYGYLGIDDRYHQVTYYWGESDSTPSILVRKTRGDETGWGITLFNTRYIYRGRLSPTRW
jgi:hypothetical protein